MFMGFLASWTSHKQELIEVCVAQLEKELTDISSKAAYNLACSMSTECTSIENTRLIFLRAESFDPYNAAFEWHAFLIKKCHLFVVPLMKFPLLKVVALWHCHKKNAPVAKCFLSSLNSSRFERHNI
jgi:hypothetical protein